MRTLNLGILAHVDAGKTSLTERLLYAVGAIQTIGSVDRGDTQTDNLALERERGITIRAAVASFVVDDVTINLIDTPGHPDFIAEVERALQVLDGVVLVVSAVEGVQAQTRVLMRALQQARLPTILFVNKIDRRGAREAETVANIRARLEGEFVVLGCTRDIGSATAEFVRFADEDAEYLAALRPALAAQDDALLEAFVNEQRLTSIALNAALVAQCHAGLVHPLLFGSAITGAGTDQLLRTIVALLPARTADAHAALSATVFKIERGTAGERIAYVCVHEGCLRRGARPRGDDVHGGKVNALAVFDRGSCNATEQLDAGRIGKVWGLGDIRIGDVIGVARAGASVTRFAPPTLDSIVRPLHAHDAPRLHVALTQLAEQDPLIGMRQAADSGELHLSLYGEVQKEVIAHTLRHDYGVDAEFVGTTMICIERPLGVGFAVEGPPRPFIALAALRIEPGPLGSGVQMRLEIPNGVLPRAFFAAIEAAVHECLQYGLCGWQVTDCVVSVTQAIRLRDWAASSAAAHRDLVPLVLLRALLEAGTVVCEPVQRFVLEVPVDTMAGVLQQLARVGAMLEARADAGRRSVGRLQDVGVLNGEIAAARVHELQHRLPALTRGEGVLELTFSRYRPVSDAPPMRTRPASHALDRKAYLAALAGRRSVQ